jgi:hypothetical protein
MEDVIELGYVVGCEHTAAEMQLALLQLRADLHNR